MDKKLVITLSITVLLITLGIVRINALNEQTNQLTNEYTETLDPTSNFFAQVETYEVVENKDLDEGFIQKAENNFVILYVKEDTLSIALQVKETGYIWYSTYPDYEKYDYTEGLENYIQSGVTIEYFNARTLYESQADVLSDDTVLTYTYSSDGFVVTVDFEDVGISFDVGVWIDGGQLHTKVFSDTIEEKYIELKSKKYPIENKLKSVQLFPFFGSENYEIDGYSFIPDGSGALIRYEDIPNTTAYKARVYGDDLGYRNDIVLYEHLSETPNVTMPIYGVVHGVKQNGFLYEVTSGDEYSELYSLPYQYLTDFNTTFMKFIYREKYVVRFSSSDETGIALIDEVPTETNMESTYTFLSNDKADYIGMAAEYESNFAFNSSTTNSDIPVRLELIGLEYKNGLFGKNYVEMTKYNDALQILRDLDNRGVSNPLVVYESYNKNGFYDNSPVDPKTSLKLGGRDDFKELVDYVKSNNLTLELYNDSYISFDNSFNRDLANQVTLKLFEINSDSDLFDYEYYRKPDLLADPFVDNLSGYNKLGINTVAVDSVGSVLFSYRENQEQVSRTTSKDLVVSELEELTTDFKVSLYQPNQYTFSYVNNAYDIPLESNRYPFMTDSIPFTQILLSGHVNTFSEYANFMSDYYLYSLRMIEYGMYPSFILTSEPTYDLRYTNSEHIYTSEYDLWKEHISDMYKIVNDALKHVTGEQIVDYKYVSYGVSVVTYSNDVEIVVNYTSTSYDYEGLVVEPLQYAVKEAN